MAAPNSPVVAQLGQATGSAVDYRPLLTPDAAADAVRRGHVIGAVLAPASPNPTLLVTSAHQFQAASIASGTLGRVFSAEHRTLTVSDLAPLPPYDSFGMTAMYLMLTWCIGGYMVAMFIGMMGGPLRHRTRVSIIIGGAVVVSLLSNILAGPVLGAVHGHFGELVAIAIGWVIAIGLAVNGLSYFAGRFITLPAIAICPATRCSTTVVRSEPRTPIAGNRPLIIRIPASANGKVRKRRAPRHGSPVPPGVLTPSAR